jgi:hypothetical protein
MRPETSPRLLIPISGAANHPEAEAGHAFKHYALNYELKLKIDNSGLIRIFHPEIQDRTGLITTALFNKKQLVWFRKHRYV